MDGIALGDTVKDKVSGFTGVVVAIINYLYGSSRAQVVSKVVDSKNQPVDQWFDLDQLSIESKG